jgi:signal transduction histidine kinase/DNA-binding response OmpR family regulator
MAIFSYTLLGLMFIVMLAIIYFSKQRINNYETRIYGTIIITNIIGQILHLLCFVVIKYIDSIPKLLFYGVTKGYLLYLVSWGILNMVYIFLVSFLDDSNQNREEVVKNGRLLGLIGIIISFSIILLLPISYSNSIEGMYTYGPSVDSVYIISIVIVISCITMIFAKFNKDKIKKYIPIFLFIIIGSLTMLVQRIHPELLLITFVETFVTFLMYFTIENPDVRLIEQLEIAKEQADKANNAKTDFLSNMSHEIRTPLNAIVGFSENLKDENIPESARENVEDIIMASNNLLDIVNGILDISKIEANKLEIINKEYDIKSMIDELIALTKARLGEKPIDFKVNIDPSIPKVLYGDNIRLKQIILNLLTNAAKYTKEGYILFTMSSVIKDDICRLIIAVEDSGIGIKEENLPKLFSKFERLNVEKQITIEGTGLGLAITKKLVELMNGTIVVQSVYGKGSKFTVSIDQRIISIEEPLTKAAPATTSTIIDANGARVLIVDDNELNIKVASVLLKKYHFNIDSCTSGFECVEKIKNNEKYDIIFMDDMMPRMNGRTTLLKLREIEGFNIPVVALTANAITGMKEEYLSFGFNDYLSKPIERRELERIIKEYIQNSNKASINTNTTYSQKSVMEELGIELPQLSQVKQNNKNILIVDDNDVNIKVLSASLKKYNYSIDSCNSGSEAINKVIDNNKYDLIFMDEMMPELNGCETLENLESIEGFKTPVIMVSASSKDEVKDKLEKYNFSGYLSKPFNKDQLDEILTHNLN